MTGSIPAVPTARLDLRPLSPDDADALQAIMHQPGVLRYFPNTQPPRLVQVAALIARQLEHWEEHGYGWWAVDHRSADSFIGWCGLQYLPDTDEVEVAYHLDRRYWGRGLATEASTAAVQFGLDVVGLSSIIALAHPDNARSIRVMQKLGMTFTDEAVYFGMPVHKYCLARGPACPAARQARLGNV